MRKLLIVLLAGILFSCSKSSSDKITDNSGYWLVNGVRHTVDSTWDQQKTISFQENKSYILTVTYKQFPIQSSVDTIGSLKGTVSINIKDGGDYYGSIDTSLVVISTYSGGVLHVSVPAINLRYPSSPPAKPDVKVSAELNYKL